MQTYIELPHVQNTDTCTYMRIYIQTYTEHIQNKPMYRTHITQIQMCECVYVCVSVCMCVCARVPRLVRRITFRTLV